MAVLIRTEKTNLHLNGGAPECLAASVGKNGAGDKDRGLVKNARAFDDAGIARRIFQNPLAP